MGLGIKIPKNAFEAGRKALSEGDDFNNVELPPGRYTCILKSGRAVETKNGSQIVFDLEVAGEADQKGGRISIFFSLQEERIVWLFRLLTLLGYDVSELNESTLEEILNDIKSTTPVVRVSAKASGEYTNYRVDKLISELTAADARGGGEDSGTESAADEEAAGGKAGIKPGKGKPAPKKEEPAEEEPAEEEDPPGEEEVVEEEPAAEEEVELKVGMKVKAKIKGAVHQVTVLEIGDDNKVLIESKTDKKKYRTSVENLEI